MESFVFGHIQFAPFKRIWHLSSIKYTVTALRPGKIQVFLSDYLMKPIIINFNLSKTFRFFFLRFLLINQKIRATSGHIWNDHCKGQKVFQNWTVFLNILISVVHLSCETRVQVWVSEKCAQENICYLWRAYISPGWGWFRLFVLMRPRFTIVYLLIRMTSEN